MLRDVGRDQGDTQLTLVALWEKALSHTPEKMLSTAQILASCLLGILSER